jgi:hypothetical protein
VSRISKKNESLHIPEPLWAFTACYKDNVTLLLNISGKYTEFSSTQLMVCIPEDRQYRLLLSIICGTDAALESKASSTLVFLPSFKCILKVMVCECCEASAILPPSPQLDQSDGIFNREERKVAGAMSARRMGENGWGKKVVWLLDKTCLVKVLPCRNATARFRAKFREELYVYFHAIAVELHSNMRR